MFITVLRKTYLSNAYKKPSKLKEKDQKLLVKLELEDPLCQHKRNLSYPRNEGEEDLNHIDQKAQKDFEKVLSRKMI